MIVNTSGSPQAYTDYYPFGLTMPGRSSISGGVDARYKFTGKERDAAETGYDYFGPGRYFNPWDGRWLQVDPLAQEIPSWTPYRYCFNNPLRFFDPGGNTEKERKIAIQTSKNMIGTPYVHGGMSKSGFDCSGLVRYCMTQNVTIQDPIRFWKNGDNGVATIIKASTEIQINQIEVGNIVVIKSGNRDDGHVAFISEVTQDEYGNVISYKIIHAEAPWSNVKTGQSGGGDVNEPTIIVGGNSGYSQEKYHHRFFKWDNPDDKNVATNNLNNSSNAQDNKTQSWQDYLNRFMNWMSTLTSNY